MGKSQREKGKRGERATATEIREAIPELSDRIKRGWQSRAGSDDPDVCGLPGYWIENKCGKKPNPRAALQQAIDATNTLKVALTPFAVVRDDRKEPFAIMRWRDLLHLIRRDLIAERHIQPRPVCDECKGITGHVYPCSKAQWTQRSQPL